MPSSNYSIAQIQSFLVNRFNQQVTQHFSDLPTYDPTQPVSTENSRAMARQVCLHTPTDSALVSLLRLLIYELEVNPQVYDQIVQHEAAVTDRSNKPEIRLYFKELLSEVEPGYDQLACQTSFRLMNETQQSLTKTVQLSYAQKIQTQFARPTVYTRKAGQTMYSYADWDIGVQFQLLLRSDTDAEDLVTRLLAIQGETIDLALLNVSQNKNPTVAYPTIPPTTTIAGKTYKQKRVRPTWIGNYQYATLRIPGLSSVIVLHDSTGAKKNALLRN